MPIDYNNSPRKLEILKLFQDESGMDKLLEPLINDMIKIEYELEALKKMPWLLTNKKNPALQKRSEAADLYIRLISRYTDIINKLGTHLRRSEGDEESPLRAYLNGLKDEN